MTRKKKISLGTLALTATLLLSGCGKSVAQEIAQYPIYDTRDILITQDVAGTDEELTGIVYQFVTNNMKIDPENLIAPTSEETTLINKQMERIVSALKGKENNSISDEMLNYMLLEFAKTQKEWKLDDNGISILGIDPATRKIFVDATFVTTGYNKIEIPQSKIIKGDPLEEALKEARYTQYMEYMALKYPSEEDSWTVETEEDKAKRDAEIAKAKSDFEKTWGTISSVLFEQQELTLIARLRNAIQTRDTSVSTVKEDNFYKVTGETKGGKPSTTTLSDEALRYIEARGIGTYTYTGITKQNTFDDNAIMRFRFILDFDFNLGSNTTITTTSVYLYDYSVVGYEEPLSRMTISETAKNSLSVIKPYVDRTINSYQKSIEESNYIGLYSLFGTAKTKDEYTGKILSTASRFADWDKYYVDLNRYCYVKYEGYDYEILGWEGNAIQVLVTRSKKVRGKGTQMSMPTYTEKALITLVVEEDNLYIESEEVLSTEITGEPISMIKDVTGIADKIAYNEKSFSAENEQQVISAIQAFSKAQLEFANGNESVFTSKIDYGVGNAQVAQIKTIASNIKSDEKITWLGTWATKSNVYCRVRIREYFKCSDSDVDTEAYIGLVNRDGKWAVVTYERTMATVCERTDVSDKGCLSHDYLNKESTSDYTASTTGSNNTASQIDKDTGTVPQTTLDIQPTSVPETSTDSSDNTTESKGTESSVDTSKSEATDSSEATDTSKIESSSASDTLEGSQLSFDDIDPQKFLQALESAQKSNPDLAIFTDSWREYIATGKQPEVTEVDDPELLTAFLQVYVDYLRENGTSEQVTQAEYMLNLYKGLIQMAGNTSGSGTSGDMSQVLDMMNGFTESSVVN